jgi:flagellar basal-body rod protein FlgB
MDMMGVYKTLENSLDASSLRQTVTANNIANAGVKGYEAQSVAFEDEMKKALDEQQGKGEFKMVSNTEEEEDGHIKFEQNPDPNNVRARVFNTGQRVDIHKEMVNLAQNQIQYNMLSDKIGGFLKATQMVIDSIK